jgi:hypothetical protein
VKKTLLQLFLLLIVGCWPVLAQPGDPAGDPDVPITGIELLLAAGGLLGARKLLQSRNKSD